MDLAIAAFGVPVPPDLLGIYDAGGGTTRRGAGRVARHETPVALPSVSWRRIRSRPL